MYMVVYHLQQVLAVSPVLHRLFTHGWLDTDFFVVLSGFGIDQGYRTKLKSGSISYSDFVRSRYKRIWPRYVCALILFAIVLNGALAFGVSSLHPPSASAWFKEAVMLTGTGLDHEPRWWNGPMWTVNALMICYVVYPLLLRVPQIALAIPLVITSCLHPSFLHYSDLRWGIVRVFPLFLLGVAISGIFRARREPVLTKSVADLSFALYLTHFLVVLLIANRLQVFTPNPTQAILSVAGLLSVCLLLAWCFEESFQQLAASRLRLRRELAGAVLPALQAAGSPRNGLAGWLRSCFRRAPAPVNFSRLTLH